MLFFAATIFLRAKKFLTARPLQNKAEHLFSRHGSAQLIKWASKYLAKNTHSFDFDVFAKAVYVECWRTGTFSWVYWNVDLCFCIFLREVVLKAHWSVLQNDTQNLSIYEWKPKDTSTNLYLLRSSHWRFYVRKGALSIFAKFIFELKHKCIWTRNDGHYEMKKLIVTCNLPVLSAVGLNPTFIIWFRIFEQFSIWSNY